MNRNPDLKEANNNLSLSEIPRVPASAAPGSNVSPKDARSDVQVELTQAAGPPPKSLKKSSVLDDAGAVDLHGTTPSPADGKGGKEQPRQAANRGTKQHDVRYDMRLNPILNTPKKNFETEQKPQGLKEIKTEYGLTKEAKTTVLNIEPVVETVDNTFEGILVSAMIPCTNLAAKAEDFSFQVTAIDHYPGRVSDRHPVHTKVTVGKVFEDFKELHFEMRTNEPGRHEVLICYNGPENVIVQNGHVEIEVLPLDRNSGRLISWPKEVAFETDHRTLQQLCKENKWTMPQWCSQEKLREFVYNKIEELEKQKLPLPGAAPTVEAEAPSPLFGQGSSTPKPAAPVKKTIFNWNTPKNTPKPPPTSKPTAPKLKPQSKSTFNKTPAPLAQSTPAQPALKQQPQRPNSAATGKPTPMMQEPRPIETVRKTAALPLGVYEATPVTLEFNGIEVNLGIKLVVSDPRMFQMAQRWTTVGACAESYPIPAGAETGPQVKCATTESMDLYRAICEASMARNQHLIVDVGGGMWARLVPIFGVIHAFVFFTDIVVPDIKELDGWERITVAEPKGVAAPKGDVAAEQPKGSPITPTMVAVTKIFATAPVVSTYTFKMSQSNDDVGTPYVPPVPLVGLKPQRSVVPLGALSNPQTVLPIPNAEPANSTSMEISGVNPIPTSKSSLSGAPTGAYTPAPTIASTVDPSVPAASNSSFAASTPLPAVARATSLPNTQFSVQGEVLAYFKARLGVLETELVARRNELVARQNEITTRENELTNLKALVAKFEQN